jgi:predicted nucleic acid-binding protein
LSAEPQQFVLDASVALRPFLGEPGGGKVTRLVELAEKVIVPDLFYAECANVLWKRARWHGLAQELGAHVLHQLLKAQLMRVPCAVLVEDAASIALRTGISAYDAIYVALAVRRNIPLLTADRCLIALMQEHGYPVAPFKVDE